jgi:multidrug efflux system membrane fusion protein
LSEVEAGRYEKLFEQGVVSKEDYDDRRARAEADRAIVRGDEAAIKRAQLDVEYCSIRSPLGGRTGALGVDEGNLVKPNDTVLVVIDQLAPIYVRFAIPEQRLPEVQHRMAEGQLSVRAKPEGDDGPPETGVLTFIDRAVDPSTGTIMLKALFENSSRRLWPGEFVNAVLRLGERSRAIVVPEQAVQEGQKGSQVFVVDADSRAELREVSVGPRTDGQIVIERGLREGEIVVTDGQLMLAPGSRVTPRAEGAGPPVAESQP